MTNKPRYPDLDSILNQLTEARRRAYEIADDTGQRDPSADQLTAFAAITALTELTEQLHHLTLATRDHTAELERARWRADS